MGWWRKYLVGREWRGLGGGSGHKGESEEGVLRREGEGVLTRERGRE